MRDPEKAAGVDKKMVEAAQQGDAQAIENLLIYCRPDVRRYAALTCHAADIEDAVQEALLIVFRKVSSLRSVLLFSRWVFQIVCRECLRRLPKNHTELNAVEETYLATHSDLDLRLDLARAIQSLPPLYHEIIVLRDFEERTIGEIAEKTGLPPETVKTRIYRGRHLMREHLLA